MVGPFTYIQKVMSIVGTVLCPAIPVINVTEIRTHHSSFLNAHILRLARNSSKNRLAKVRLFCTGVF